MPVRLGQLAKVKLVAAGALEPGLKLFSLAGRLYFPLRAGVKVPLEKGSFKESAALFAVSGRKATSLRDALWGKLGKGGESVLRSYDLVGDIAVLNIPKALASKRKLIANALLESNPRIRVVARKGVTRGEYRVRLASVLAGEKRTRTVYRENGCAYKVDLAKAYFSTRLGFERKRVADLSGSSERVLVLFAGVGPFAIPIARKMLQSAPRGRVVAVEWNPYAAKALRENASLNKVADLLLVLKQDARKVVSSPAYSRWADRIVMPLLHESIPFIPQALEAAARGCTIHAYGLVSTRNGEQAGLEATQKQVLSLCRKAGRKCRVAGARFCGAYAPRVQQAAFDVVVEN